MALEPYGFKRELSSVALPEEAATPRTEARLPRYFFDLHGGDELLIDHEGIVLPHSDAATSAALLQARDILAGDIRGGSLALNLWLAVRNEAGAIVHELSFQDAVEIRWPHEKTGVARLG